MNIIIVKTLDISYEKLEKLCNHITYDRRIKINRFLNRNDKIQSLISDILIRTELIKRFNVKNESISFSKNLYGKPYVERFENFHFNISHSGEYVAVAISEKEVGIDIEKIEDIEYLEIAKNFFTNKEFNYIASNNKERDLVKFYEIWTLKEAYIKFKGRGLSIPLNSFSIIDNNKSFKVIDNVNDNNYVFDQINILPCYKLALCSLNNQSINIKRLNQNELIDYFLELVEKENA